MIAQVRQGMLADGSRCRWFGMPQRSAYYRPRKAVPKVRTEFSEPVKALIEAEPSFGYRTVPHLLGFNKNTVQRLFQLMRWQVRDRPIGFRPRVQALSSVAEQTNQRGATDLCRICCGRDAWAVLALAAASPSPSSCAQTTV